MVVDVQPRCPFAVGDFGFTSNEGDGDRIRAQTFEHKSNNNDIKHCDVNPESLRSHFGEDPVSGNGIFAVWEFPKVLGGDGQAKTMPSISPRMALLLEGKDHPGDCGNPIEPPEWLDREKFDRGRQFCKKYMFCIFFSDLISLLMTFSMGRMLRALIYTGRSDTVLRSFRRYVSTALHVLTWSTGDVWDPADQAHSDILKVRKIHLWYSQLFNSPKIHPKVDAMNVKSRGHEPGSHVLSPTIRRDLRLHNKRIGPGVPTDPPNLSDVVYISQMDMALTQFAFFGLLILHPRRLGLWWVSRQELESLVHYWRGLGWLLGIDDKYNLGAGTLDETVALCKEIEELMVKPHLVSVAWDYEYMSDCLIKGTNLYIPCLSLPVLFRFLATTLGLRVPGLAATMSWTHSAHYWTMRFVFQFLFAIAPGIMKYMNKGLLLTLEVVQGKKKSKRKKEIPVAKPMVYWL